MRILIIALPWLLVAYAAGILSHKWWLSFIKKKEDRIRVRIAQESIESLPTKILAEELFDREEVWEVISDQADKNHRN